MSHCSLTSLQAFSKHMSEMGTFLASGFVSASQQLPYRIKLAATNFAAVLMLSHRALIHFSDVGVTCSFACTGFLST